MTARMAKTVARVGITKERVALNENIFVKEGDAGT
jgi:hypothetical protein